VKEIMSNDDWFDSLEDEIVESVIPPLQQQQQQQQLQQQQPQQPNRFQQSRDTGQRARSVSGPSVSSSLGSSRNRFSDSLLLRHVPQIQQSGSESVVKTTMSDDDWFDSLENKVVRPVYTPIPPVQQQLQQQSLIIQYEEELLIQQQLNQQQLQQQQQFIGLELSQKQTRARSAGSSVVSLAGESKNRLTDHRHIPNTQTRSERGMR
jgi:hypothetical protein